MKNNVEKALSNFVEVESQDDENNQKEVILREREGIIERVDRIFVTKDGKQLLREQY